jgi:hypothetical protein
MNDKRKKVEEKIYKTLDLLDPSGLNSGKYRKLFGGMSDNQFTAYFKAMKADDDRNFYVEVDMYGKNNPTLKTVQSAADYLKLPLEEYVYIKHKNPDGEPIRSRYKVPVFHLHLKRMQQILSKKVRLNTEIAGAGVRSRLTGAIGSAHKTGRVSDADTIALISVADLGEESLIRNEGSNEVNSAILNEFLGARADDMDRKMEMQSAISLYGYAKQTNFKPRPLLIPRASQAVNTLDVYLIGAGMKSDVVTQGLQLRQYFLKKKRGEDEAKLK